MNEKPKNSIVALIDDFNATKNEFKKKLLLADSQNLKLEEQPITSTEQKLESCFESLLDYSPQNLVEMSVKFETIFKEIISESELTEYHKKAMQSVLSDLNNYSKENKK